MSPIVAVVAQGAMGAGVGQRLAEQGAQVITSLTGRSGASAERARAAGMKVVTDDKLADADFFLSIVPPADALALASRLAPVFAKARHKPVYVDCNAINTATMAAVADTLSAAGVTVVDAGIVGGPPKPGVKSPIFFASGAAAGRFMELARNGLDIRVLDAPIGAASAVKMSYAGITKGMTALCSSMMLEASRAGVAEVLHAALVETHPGLMTMLNRSVPDMFVKAYRFVGEMQQIAGFAAANPGAAKLFDGAADIYISLAADMAGPKKDIGTLSAFMNMK